MFMSTIVAFGGKSDRWWCQSASCVINCFQGRDPTTKCSINNPEANLNNK